MALTITPQVTSLTGTTNRITVSASNGEVTLNSGSNIVYTTGSYSDPSWISISASKVGLGNVTNESKSTMFSSPAFTGNITLTGLTTGTTAGTLSNTSSPNTGVSNALAWNGYFYAGRVYNAIWNDIADFIFVDENVKIEFGKVYYRKNDYSIVQTDKYASRAIGIASDTYGFGVGQKKEGKQIPIAIGGWVLAYTDKIYKPGTPLVATKEGKLTKARWYTVILNSDRVIAHFDRPELKPIWNGIEVNTRNWVKVR